MARPYFDKNAKAWRYSTQNGKWTLGKETRPVDQVDRDNPPQWVWDALQAKLATSSTPTIPTATASVSTTSIEQTCEAWLRKVNTDIVPPNTILNRKNGVKHLLAFAKVKGIKSLSAIDETALTNYVAYLSRTLKFKPSTVRTNYQIIQPLFGLSEYTGKNPNTAAVRDLLPEVKLTLRFLTVEDARKVFQDIQDGVKRNKRGYPKWLLDLTTIMYTMGLRVQTALAMEADWATTSTEGKPILQIPKQHGTKTGYDTPLSPSVAAIIERTKAEGRTKVFNSVTPSMSRKVYEKIFMRVLGRKVRSPNHCWRHSLGYNLHNHEDYAKETSIVQVVLGHSDPSTTTKYYAPTSVDKAARALKGFDGF